jgi:homoserine kinase type II
MAVYTEINQSEAQLIFNELGEIQDIKGITEGVENTNYIITLTNQTKFIFTIFEKRTK